MTGRQSSRAVLFSLVVVLSAFAVVAAVGGPAAAVSVDATDWSQFRNDTHNTGNNSNVAGPVSDTSERWNKTTAGRVFSSPAVVDDTVYVGSDDGNVYALYTKNGTQRWREPIGSPVHSSPAVANDTVFVGSSDDRLYALYAANGSERWNTTTGGNIDSSPTVVNGTVYVGSDDNRLYAFYENNGSVRWTAKFSGAVDSSPAVVNETNTVYVGSDSGVVSALNAVDGSWKWNYTTSGGEVNSSPAVVNDTVYFGNNDGYVYALNATDGSELWTNQIDSDGRVQSSPAVDNSTDTVYVGADNGLVVALNATANNGSAIWTGATADSITSSPALVGDTVYIGSTGGSVYGWNATDGTKRWQHRLGSEVNSSPAVANDAVYVGTKIGTVYALGKPAYINGTLTDTNGNQIQGVKVEFEYAGSSNRFVGSTTSDSNGDYSFVVPDATRDYEIIINSQNWTFVEKESLSVDNGQTKTQDITLVKGGLINGTVTDSNGNPISDIRVETYKSSKIGSGDFVRSETTDANGDYSIRVVGGTYDVVVNDPDYDLGLRGNVSVTNETTTQVKTIQLTGQAGTGFINGTVQDSNGNPIEDANVFGRDASFENFPGDKTDSNGDFSLEAPQGDYIVRVEKSGFAPAVRENINITEGQTTDITLTLQQPGYINGTVTNASGSAPQNAFVIVETGKGIRPGPVDPTTGKYNVSVPSGTHRVSVFSQDGTASSKTVSVSAGEINTTDFQIVNTTIIHDSVTVLSDPGSDVDTANLEMRTDLQSGFLQAQLVNLSNRRFAMSEGLGIPAELQGLGVNDTTQFRMNITVTNFTANSLLWGLDDANWSTSPNASVTNGTDITITGSPANMQVNTSRRIGPLINQDPSQVQWPANQNDQADFGFNRTVYIGLFDLSTVPGEVRSALSGMSVTTNAQTFSIPSVQNDSLRIWQAAPSFTTEGNKHGGFYQADIPQATLDDWNVSDPESELAVSYKNRPAEATITDTADGARVRIENISYSAGFAEIKAKEPTQESSGGSTSTSTGSSGAGAGGVGTSRPSKVSVKQTDTGTTATIQRVTLNDPTVTVSTTGASAGGVSVTEVSATFEKGSNEQNTMSISASTSPPSGAPSPPNAGGVFSYVDVTVQGPLASSISEGRFTVDVSERGVDPASVTAHRYDGSEWQEVETEPVGETTVAVISPDGYSAFAIGASETDEPAQPTATPTDDETEGAGAETTTPAETDTPAATATPTPAEAATATPGGTATPAPTPTPGGSGPGFGLGVALVALLATLLALRRR